MKLILITKEEVAETREAKELADNIESEGFTVEKIDWESDEATSLARLYDIYNPPAFIITDDTGRQVEQWQGSELPLAHDIKHLM